MFGLEMNFQFEAAMISREDYLQELIQFKDTDFIKVITGVRRSGKSVLLTQYQAYLQRRYIFTR